MAFVLLACLAVAIVGIRAAEASRGVFLAAAVGAVTEVHGTIPTPSEADRRSAAERVEALGPAFAALNGDAATVTILSAPGTAVPARSTTGATVAARGTATAVSSTRGARPGTSDRDVAPEQDATRDRSSGPSTRAGAASHRSHDVAVRGPRRPAVAGPAPDRDTGKHRGAVRPASRDGGAQHRAGAAQRSTNHTRSSTGTGSAQRRAGSDGRGNGRGNGRGQGTRHGTAHRPGR
jgi:hypothetical protein